MLPIKMESYDRSNSPVGDKFHSAVKQQLSAVMDMMLARKVRVSLPDQSGLLLQSLGQLNDKSSPIQLQPLCTSSYIQRVPFTSQASEETLNGSRVDSRLSSAFIPSAVLAISTDTDGNTTNSNSTSATATANNKSDSSANKYAFNNESNPHQPVLSSLIGTKQQESNTNSDLLHQFHGDLLKVAEESTSDAQKSLASNLSNTDSFGFGILSRTRQFGAWLSKATGGEKVEVTKNDLNALAPNSF